MDDNWWKWLENLGQVLKGKMLFFAKRILKKNKREPLTMMGKKGSIQKRNQWQLQI